jgi:hypothetical protein
MKTILHVNQHVIRKNRKEGRNDPPLIVRNYKGRKNAHRVAIDGPATLVHSEKPLDCGAHCWIETQAPVRILDEVSA